MWGRVFFLCVHSNVVPSELAGVSIGLNRENTIAIQNESGDYNV